jgi:carboxyl-terminal processing protease
MQDLLDKAQNWERLKQWDKACLIYEQLLQLDRKTPQFQDQYFHCIRRYLQASRHKDQTYHKEVLSLEFGQSLRLHDFLMTFLLNHSFNQGKVTARDVFQKGLAEFRHALEDPTFQQAHLKTVAPKKIREFSQAVEMAWGGRSIYSVEQATAEVREIATEAFKKLKLKPTTVVMEFTCGGCYVFDNYTMYLTPQELSRLCNSLKGESVGIGLKVGMRASKMVITHITLGGPAAELEPPLLVGDPVASIHGQPTDQMSVETAMDLLQGEMGSKVDLIIEYPEMARSVTLMRRPGFLPCIDFEMKSMMVGYISLRSFQDTTTDELDTALANLEKSGMRALVLDLRGNRGGLVEAAIESARRFLTKGVIVSTKTSDPKFDVTYFSDNPMALTMPMVILVDGETASAAEILAGALKDNGRGKLVGQPTYGKSCIQEVYRLNPQPGIHYPGGLRITVARFHSPSGKPYTGNSIVPHLFVDDDPGYSSLAPSDPQLETAIVEAHKLLDMSGRVPR